MQLTQKEHVRPFLTRASCDVTVCFFFFLFTVESLHNTKKQAKAIQAWKVMNI